MRLRLPRPFEGALVVVATLLAAWSLFLSIGLGAARASSHAQHRCTSAALGAFHAGQTNRAFQLLDASLEAYVSGECPAHLTVKLNEDQ